MGGGADRKGASRFVALGGLAGLFLGFTLGEIVHRGAAPWLQATLPALEPVGRLWMNALRLAVVPLTFCLLAVGVCAIPKGRELGMWGARTLAWMVALLIAGALFAIFALRVYLSASPPAPIRLPASVPASQPAPNGDWVSLLVPTNAFEAAAKGDVLPIAVVALLFGLALRAIGEERRKPVQDLLATVRDAVLVFVHWVILALPLGVFALSFAFAADSGLGAAGTLVHFASVVAALLTVAIVAVAAAVLFAAKRPKGEVLGAMAPLLAVAAGTRSSLASLPSLIESAQGLGLPAPAEDIVLPTCVTLFKMNRTISSVAKAMFLAAALGIAIGPGALAVFVGSVVVLSFATPGLPAGGSNVTWGAYLAVGLPLEAIVLVEMTDPLTDVFKTVLNVLADFAVAVFVSRGVLKSRTAPSQKVEAPS